MYVLLLWYKNYFHSSFICIFFSSKKDVDLNLRIVTSNI